MNLPYVIEYLLTIRRLRGGSLVHQGATQIYIPIVPPNFQFVLNIFPAGNDYFDIVYNIQIDPAVVPGVYYGWGQYYGSRVSEGIFTGGWIAHPSGALVFISESEPAVALIRNITPVHQFYAGITFFISIATQEDYELVLDALDRMGTSTKSEQLAEESKNLLIKLTGGGS